MSFLGFISTWLGLRKCLAQGHSREKPRGSNAGLPRNHAPPGLRVTAAAHIIHIHVIVISGFHQNMAWVLKCLAQGHSHEKSRGSKAARTPEPLSLD